MKYGKSEKPGTTIVPVTNENKTVEVCDCSRFEHLESSHFGRRLALLDPKVTTVGQGYVVAPITGEFLTADYAEFSYQVDLRLGRGLEDYDAYYLLKHTALKSPFRGTAWCAMLFPTEGGLYGFTYVGDYCYAAGLLGQYAPRYWGAWCGRL